MSTQNLKSSFQLPCGLTMQNRLAKAAMTERRATGAHNPNGYHHNLYDIWGSNGAGMLITGNIMVDRRYLESGGNIVVEDERALNALAQLAETAKQAGSLFIGQISNSGRQTSRLVNSKPISASNIQLKQQGLYAKPRPLTEIEIREQINRFATTAAILQKAGFDGIQIHGAHGYLISQFLSPLTNRREDQWGGSLENRARFLKEIVIEIKNRTQHSSQPFAVTVKLNSADFQRGGFTEKESLQVISMLEKLQVDLVEVSGGNYETPSFFNHKKISKSTQQREAYFLEFASKVRKVSKAPLMITGGFRSLEVVEKALQNKEADVIGMARPFLLSKTFARDFLDGDITRADVPDISIGLKSLSLMAQAGWYDIQILRLARRQNPKLSTGAWRSLVHILNHETIRAFAHRFAG